MHVKKLISIIHLFRGDFSFPVKFHLKIKIKESRQAEPCSQSLCEWRLLDETKNLLREVAAQSKNKALIDRMKST